MNPFKRIKKDPYNDKKLKKFIYNNNGYCGYKYINNNKIKYILKSYNTIKEAKNDGAYITHTGKCGVCSTLHDLSVYYKYPNLTKIIKKCNIFNFLSNKK